jgi:MFS family permease
VGTALGPSLGGVLIAAFGWPSVFATMALAGVGALLLATWTLPGNLPVIRQWPSLDLPGIVLLALSLGAYALATTLDANTSVRAALAVGSVLGLIAFVAVEAQAASPLIQLHLLRNAELSSGLLALGLVSAILMATLVVGPFYLSDALGLGPVATGLVMTVGPGIVALVGVPAGQLVDRLGSPTVTFTGLSGVVLGSGLMSWLPGHFGVGDYIVSLALITMGYALFQVANNAAVMSTATADRRGVTSALLALARNLGLVTGASAMGALFTMGPHTAGILGPAAGEAGLRLTFPAAASLGGLALAAAWWGLRSRTPGVS